MYCVYCGLRILYLPQGPVCNTCCFSCGAYIINQYALKMLGGPVGGYLTDKYSFRHKISARCICYYGNSPGCLCVPAHSHMNVYFGMLMTSASAPVYSACAPSSCSHGRDSCSQEITGSAMSLGSFIGYLPGAFLYSIYGSILDHNRHQRLPHCIPYHGRIRRCRIPAEQLHIKCDWKG